jgi:hypothetical protein
VSFTDELIKTEHTRLSAAHRVDAVSLRPRQLLPRLWKRKEGEVPKPCEVKRDLLVEYLSTLQQLKVADWEHKQILVVGTGDGVALRSAQRIEAIKSLCTEARVKYIAHCRAHRC